MATDDLRVPRLVVTEPADRAGTVLPLSAPELVIGHSDTADLVLDDRYVSRRHALVSVDPVSVDPGPELDQRDIRQREAAHRPTCAATR
jgi:pSer/pThr/pTyr-binding forkhead associated (FHA) protein